LAAHEAANGRGANIKEPIMTKQAQTACARPTHRIYNVTGAGKSAFWTPIGAAWPNRDGQGFSITCDAIPLAGRIVMRRITERLERTGQ
jgi:hypothetical protein